MINRKNNGQNLINLIVDTIAENKEIKEFLSCAKYPEERKQYLEGKVSNLFNGCEVSKEFLDAILYGVQLKTDIDLGYSPKCVLCMGEKVVTTF